MFVVQVFVKSAKNDHRTILERPNSAKFECKKLKTSLEFFGKRVLAKYLLINFQKKKSEIAIL